VSVTVTTAADTDKARQSAKVLQQDAEAQQDAEEQSPTELAQSTAAWQPASLRLAVQAMPL
jgi:hypothetical protein